MMLFLQALLMFKKKNIYIYIISRVTICNFTVKKKNCKKH